MSKREEQAAIKVYPILFSERNHYDNTFKDMRESYIKGYEQSEQDIITLIESRIAEIMGDAQPAPVLRIELRELITKIEEK